jgi:phosphate starvation-inducible protein PhoH and related proteins
VSHSAKRQAADQKRQKRQSKTIVQNTEPPVPPKQVVISARSPNQKRYMSLLDGDADIVLAEGPAGTGKTYLATLYAIRELKAGRIKRIVITRPNIGAGDDLGYLPGDLTEKMAPWTRPIIDCFREFYSAKEIEHMMESETLEIAPLVYMRGRTFKDTLLIADETQNATVDQLKMLLTRIGEGSRFFINGDTDQHDRPGGGESGFKDFLKRLEKHNDDERIAVLRFNTSDVVRHPVIETILKIYA